MPVERSKLNRCVILAGESITHRWSDTVPVHHYHSDNNVQGVETAHAEVEAEEVLVLVEVLVPDEREHPMMRLLRVLIGLDDQEYETTHNADAEVLNNSPIVPALGLRYGDRRRIAREEENRRIERARLEIKVVARVMELTQMVVTHDREAAEHHRKEKDLSGEEEPHSELGRTVSGRGIHVVNDGRLTRRHVVINYRCSTHNFLVDVSTFKPILVSPACWSSVAIRLLRYDRNLVKVLVDRRRSCLPLKTERVVGVPRCLHLAE